MKLWKLSRALGKAASLTGWAATILSGSPKRIIRRLARRQVHKAVAKVMK